MVVLVVFDSLDHLGYLLNECFRHSVCGRPCKEPALHAPGHGVALEGGAQRGPVRPRLPAGTVPVNSFQQYLRIFLIFLCGFSLNVFFQIIIIN